MMLKLRWFALCLLIGSVATAANEPGVVGWRGDGTGIFPGVTPPTKWQQISEEVAGLKFLSMPSGGDAARLMPANLPHGIIVTPDEEELVQSMPDGIIRAWLIAGPIADKDDPLNVEDQTALSPKPGDKFGEAEWKAIKIETAFVDYPKEFNILTPEPDQAAYAFSYVYSPKDASFILNYNHSGVANVWLNGKSIPRDGHKDQSMSPRPITLTKGWNRILIRCTSEKANVRKTIQWYINTSLRTTEKEAKYISQGIKWKTLLPAGNGFGSPIVTGNKILLQSEPSDLACLDAATGKILWVRSNNYNEFLTDAEKQKHPEIFKQIKDLEATLHAENESFAATGKFPKIERISGDMGIRGDGFKTKIETEVQLAKLMKEIDDEKYLLPKGQAAGHACLTPVTDGKHVWAWFANGVTCCYDLDGKLIWRRLDNEGSFYEHGYSVSPVLVDGKVIVYMRKFFAFNAKTGEHVWTTELEGRDRMWFHGTPAVAKVGGEYVLVLQQGRMMRVSDGKIIRDKAPDITFEPVEIPSPLVIGNTAYTLASYTRSTLNKLTLPEQLTDPFEPTSVQSLKMDLFSFPFYFVEWFISSPLIVDDLAYCLNNSGVLNVVDTKSMSLVYQKLLDLDHFQNTHESAGRGIGVSPAFANGNIYLVGNYGTTLVIKHGRTYEQLAKNKIESLVVRRWGPRPERFVASPTFAGKNTFLRGERYLYCLGE
ncbi:MAG: PQQ-like beta-propeller repeat protein [Phycisphaerales bacterium]|nr:PQQ-like beta-propeller repeat protein [Phycisphaerales bacterium]